MISHYLKKMTIQGLGYYHRRWDESHQLDSSPKRAIEIRHAVFLHHLHSNDGTYKMYSDVVKRDKNQLFEMYGSRSTYILKTASLITRSFFLSVKLNYRLIQTGFKMKMKMI